ncbi:hypothetical protein Voc01_088370 [Virgisporangium ochraceum]|uniref:Uncharacterized protein n=1 Tax=Virgisporangium ochraceum TaxID=65505 RepID=A0A8J4A4X8_9ACTN|nr:hypothetical protein Voc01_088370 [Virgisporangium ochraceum]
MPAAAHGDRQAGRPRLGQRRDDVGERGTWPHGGGPDSGETRENHRPTLCADLADTVELSRLTVAAVARHFGVSDAALREFLSGVG